MKFLKQQLYSFRIVESETFMEQLMEFIKILDDLAIIPVHIKDEGNGMLLLCALLSVIFCF